MINNDGLCFITERGLYLYKYLFWFRYGKYFEDIYDKYFLSIVYIIEKYYITKMAQSVSQLQYVSGSIPYRNSLEDIDIQDYMDYFSDYSIEVIDMLFDRVFYKYDKFTCICIVNSFEDGRKFLDSLTIDPLLCFSQIDNDFIKESMTQQMVENIFDYLDYDSKDLTMRQQLRYNIDDLKNTMKFGQYI